MRRFFDFFFFIKEKAKHFLLILLCLSLSSVIFSCKSTEDTEGTEKVTVDFIQSWLCADWSVSDFDTHLSALSEYGIDTLIFQSSAKYSEGKIESCSVLGMDSGLFSDSCETNNSLENFLISAKNQDFKVIIGLGFDDGWWDPANYTQEVTEGWANMDNILAQHIFETYYNDYEETIWGWYWPWEMYTSDQDFSKAWGKMLDITINSMENEGNNLPIMVSPYHSSYYSVSKARMYQVWKDFFSECNLREKDVFCPQDGFGGGDFDFNEEDEKRVMDNLSSASEAVKDFSSCRFWVNIELFSQEGDSCNKERINQQIRIANLFSPQRIACFSLSHYAISHPFGEEIMSVFSL